MDDKKGANAMRDGDKESIDGARSLDLYLSLIYFIKMEIDVIPGSRWESKRFCLIFKRSFLKL